ncbi:MAG: restriction endonuclease subunit S [Bacteroidales bacterium]|nr:restriction endonuclease subunit S [Bacteroidales bacterium]
MSEWKEYKLGDFLKVKHGYAFKGENIVTEETPNILVTPGNFNIGGGFKSDKFKYYKGDEFPKEYILTSGDIVVTMTDLSKDSDTLGYSAKIPYSTNHNYLHNQRIGLVQFVNENVCKDFVYWLMRTREYQNYIVGSASGTSIMHTSPSRIEDYRCLIPSSLSEQKRIASILSSLDDKIDLLHRENKTLEAMAETLFRQWFIDKENDSTLEQIISIQNGYNFKSNDFKDKGDSQIVKIKNISNGIVDIDSTDWVDKKITNVLLSKFQLHSGDVIIAMTGAEIGKLGIVPNNNRNLWLNQRVGLVVEKYIGAKYLAYLQLKNDFGQDYIENTATGSAQPNISGLGIEKCGFPKLGGEDIVMMSKQIGSFYDKIVFNLGQIRIITQTRDSLLPKLMSGEIKV